MSKIKIAVSACLLGKNVRYDGKNKYINLEKYFDPNCYDLESICPEVEMGLTVPREPIELQLYNNKIHLQQVGLQDNDFTQLIEDWFLEKDLKSFSAYILKSKSPSCGYQTTLLNSDAGIALSRFESGMFVQLLLNAHPNIAIIDELNVQIEQKRNHFINKIRSQRNDQPL